jgi:hypothetical protein
MYSLQIQENKTVVLLTILSDSDSKKFHYYFYEALQLKEKGKFDDALESFRICSLINPADAGVNAELGYYTHI